MSAIDPGVEDGIKEGADTIESDRSEDDRQEQEQADQKLGAEWWFASTACPLLAGRLGPMASGFNICSLVHEWRLSIPPGPGAGENDGHVIPDPRWVIAINALSLLSALIGNASLLLNMARRLRFSIAQPITITGFLLAGILLIADMAAMTSKSHYGITNPALKPPARHALTQAFYYAIFAAINYMVIGLLMCLNVYGAIRGHYKRAFELTSSQRTLMLQTMSFIAYLLLGALVYSYIEGWEFLNAVYWANVTLLTVGLGDFSPATSVGRGLLFPFAIGGILIVGLVIGSIRSLILERGKEKMGARITEKRRFNAVHNVDDRKETIKISMFAKADFSADPALSPAQRREEEFEVMRKVQEAAERERRWFALSMSGSFALILWFVGAVIFMCTEYEQEWTYLGSLYFSFTSLMTIGYGDIYPQSNSGRAFFVFWSLLAIPSLTILISNMGDTIIKWFSDITVWVGSVTVLPGEAGLRATLRNALKALTDSLKTFTLPGIFGAAPLEHPKRLSRTEYDDRMLDWLAGRLGPYVDEGDVDKPQGGKKHSDDLDQDIMFYHYVLARECRNLSKDLSASPPKNYDWADWEYYLKLMGNEDDPVDFPGQNHPDIMVPEAMRAPKHEIPSSHPGPGDNEKIVQGPTTDSAVDEEPESEDTEVASSRDHPSPELTSVVDGNVDRQTSVLEHKEASKKGHKKRHLKKNPDEEPEYLRNWSWLSNESPLMSQKSEAEWILDRLSAALERELNRTRRGYRRKPPIGLQDAQRNQSGGSADPEKISAEGEAGAREQSKLERADKDER